MSDLEVFSAMQVGEPYATYKKTILAKVYITILNPFNGEPEGVLLYGEPGTETSLVKVWTLQEDLFLKRMNINHFRNGTLVTYTLPKVEPEKTVEMSTDEEVGKIVTAPFYTLTSILTKTNSVPFLNRLLVAAREAGRTEKYTKVIEARIAEIQSVNVTQE